MTTKKPQAGQPITITIGGRDLEIRYPLKVMRALDKEHGISVFTGLGDSFSKPETLMIMLLYGLRTKQPEITEDWLDENVDASMVPALAPYLAYACTGKWVDVAARIDEIVADEIKNVNGLAGNILHGSPSGLLEDTISDSPSATSGS